MAGTTCNTEDWPRRWHQIVAEYNISFERQQNEMRSYFEDRFDLIRRENDEEVSRFRDARNACAQRVCDIIDELAELSESIGAMHEEVMRLEEEERDLAKKTSTLESMIASTVASIRQVEEDIRKSEEEHEARLLQLEAEKTVLRDEIRDLRGFLAMSKRMSTISGGSGSTIMATARKRK